MRAVVQRVTEAAVLVDGHVVGEIGAGIMALVGLREGDDMDAARRLLAKLLSLRLWPASTAAGAATPVSDASGAAADGEAGGDASGGSAGGRPWAQSLATTGGGLLLVSPGRREGGGGRGEGAPYKPSPPPSSLRALPSGEPVHAARKREEAAARLPPRHGHRAGASAV
jgi:hypothetical protein